MNNHLFFLALFLFGGLPCLYSKQLEISLQAESAILINADTGAILYEKNAHTLRYPASTTKIATALYALQKAPDKLQKVLTADQDCIGSISEEAKRQSNYKKPSYWLVKDASHMGIKNGESFTLETLLYGLMVVSADDAANVIAKYIGGTIPKFMDDLNIYLKSIGCKKTHFNNPHGLYHPEHQTTAYDLSMMMKEALKNPKFREIIATTHYRRPKTEKQESTMMAQTNMLIRKGKYFYPKAIGGKTGYISAAGHNLVVAAKDNNRTLIAVLMKCKERPTLFTDAIKLLDAAFNQPKVQKVVFKAGPQDFTLDIPGSATPVTTLLREDLNIEFYPSEEPKIKCLLYWHDLKLPIEKDQVVAEIKVQNESGNILESASLYSQEAVKKSWLTALKDLFI
jgi:D-alanyl-D-alanine carboxypeptidase (penicillin-binding protein 5/6)